MFVMVGCVRDELLAMRSGLTDVIPPELLEGLTAEVRPTTTYPIMVSHMYMYMYMLYYTLINILLSYL